MDLVEIITSDGCVVFTNRHESLALETLSSLSEGVSIYLDYHGVLDLYDSKEKTPKDICAISFLGRRSETRGKTRKDLINRISTGQIKYGVLVFERTSEPNVIGTKAWVLKASVKVPSLFIDDSKDHIDSVNKTLTITTHLIHKKSPDRKKIITKLMQIS